MTTCDLEEIFLWHTQSQLYLHDSIALFLSMCHCAHFTQVFASCSRQVREAGMRNMEANNRESNKTREIYRYNVVIICSNSRCFSMFTPSFSSTLVAGKNPASQRISRNSTSDLKTIRQASNMGKIGLGLMLGKLQISKVDVPWS